MLSATSHSLRPISPLKHHDFFTYSPFLLLPKTPPKPHFKPLSAALTPPPNSQQQLYQPFRPPPSPIPPKFRSLDTAGRMEILANRLALWYEYAPLITALIQEGFSPSTLEEVTGISGIEQNRLVVAAQVRDSLIQSKADPDIVSFFDRGGAELLYEIRLLSATQRTAAARYLVENDFDTKGAQDLAKSMKDFPRRRGDKGWERFDYTLPGDCLSFMYYRQSREHKDPSEERTAALELALKAAQSEKARSVIVEEMEGKGEGIGGKDAEIDGVRVPVVRLKIGEAAEVSKVVVLPVCRAEGKDGEILQAPFECKSVGEFGVVLAEKAWDRWVVLPGWEPVLGLGNGGVVVSFVDARALPWKANRSYNEEAILVVADRGRKEVVADDGFYLVAVEGGRLTVERGSTLKEGGAMESLGTVVLVVRPPREENDDVLADEDWE